MRFFLVVVALFAVAVPSLADCRRRCVVAVQQEVAVAAVAVPVLVPYAVQVPAYSAGYAQPAVVMSSTYSANYQAGNFQQYQARAEPAPCDVCEELRRMTSVLDRLITLQGGGAAPAAVPETVEGLRAELIKCRERLMQLEGKRPAAAPNAAPPPQPQGKVPTSATKCFACHSEASAVAQGKGFVMFKGNALKPATEFTDKQQTKILVKVSLNQMPPPDNKMKVAQLSDEEASEWPEYFK